MLTLEEYLEYQEDRYGVCLECNQIQADVDPDARKIPCDTCGEQQVFGADELLAIGMVE